MKASSTALALLVARLGRRRVRSRAASSASGYGSIQTGSMLGLPGPSPGADAGPRSTGSTRLGRLAITSRQAFVAIRYSQGRSGRVALEAGEPAPGAQQRVLERVLGVVQGAEHPVAVRVELAAVGLDEPAEGVLVAGARRVEQERCRDPPPDMPRAQTDEFHDARAGTSW